MKSRWAELKSKRRKCNGAKVRRKKIHPRQMLEKSRNAVFFQWFVCRGTRKIALLKRRAWSHAVRGEIKNCTPLWREAHFQVKRCKTRHLRSVLWSSDAQKLHVAVVRSTFWTKHVSFGARFEVMMRKNCTLPWREAHFEVKMFKNLTLSDHFGNFGCRKIARRCGEKHIYKSRC